MKQLTIPFLLERAYQHLKQVVQWKNYDKPTWSSTATQYYYLAEEILSIVEILDCGSVGGFGKGQKYTDTLFPRFIWLYLKYVGDPKTLPDYDKITKNLNDKQKD